MWPGGESGVVGGDGRVVPLVEDPSLVGGEVEAGRPEDVDELVAAGRLRLGGVDGAGRDDHHRRAVADLVAVLPPGRAIARPGPAQVVYVLALEGERALLEVVVHVG